MTPDVVYSCRDGSNEELRYSLRTLDNLPHNRVWVAGGGPSWLTGVGRIHRPQVGGKHLNSTLNILAAAQHPDVSDQFLWFNDDFFILHPLDAMPVLHRGPLDRVIDHYERRLRRHGSYLAGMRRASEILARWGFDRPLSYELHVPLLVDKKALADVITRALDESEPPLHTRTLYGNSCRIGGVEMPDCKITDKHAVPDPEAVWVSTADATFRAGAVGRWIRARFSRPSRYER